MNAYYWIMKWIFDRGKKAPNPTRAKRPLGTCDKCGRRITMTKDGSRFLRHHCESGKLPVSMAELDEFDARR
jgi:hypothetical protein